VNWLDWIDVESPEAVSDSASLVDTLVLRNERHESYWDDAAATLLQGLVLYVAALPSQERHLGTLRKVLTRPGPELEGLLRELGSEEETGFGLIARAANTFLAKADRERSGVLSVAQP
jgi:type IV secretion system protein VirD4